MKKSATYDEKVNAIAKALLKEFKTEKRVVIPEHFRTSYSNKGTDVKFTCGKLEVSFGDISDEGFGRLTCDISNKIREKLKVKKNQSINVDVEKLHAGSWMSGYDYNRVNFIEVITPCKGFFAINKKLKALGLNEIDFRKWYVDYVSGKRSHIYDHDVHYYAESEGKCKKVLDYLKGKKKVSYEFVDSDDLEDMERGERYETEWDGKMSRQICFVDSKGKRNVIY